MLGPLVALTLGESLKIALGQKKKVKNIILCIIIITLIKTGYDAHRLAVTRYPANTEIRPYLKQVLVNINKNLPRNSVILCYWSDGYPIQTYCGRPTVTDGLFESPEIVRRIIDISKIYYSYNEDELLNFCKKYGVTHILVPANRKHVYAGYAGVQYGKYYQKGGPTAMGSLTNLHKLIYTPEELNNFHRLFSNKEFSLYQVKQRGAQKRFIPRFPAIKKRKTP